MSLEPGQVAVMSRSPTGGKSTLNELDPRARTLKFVVPRSVRTGEGTGVGVATGAGAAGLPLFPPQFENDATRAPATRAAGNGRIFIKQPPVARSSSRSAAGRVAGRDQRRDGRPRIMKARRRGVKALTYC